MKFSIFEMCRMFKKVAQFGGLSQEAIETALSEEEAAMGAEEAATGAETAATEGVAGEEAAATEGVAGEEAATPTEIEAAQGIAGKKVMLNRNNQVVPTKGNEAWFNGVGQNTVQEMAKKLRMAKNKAVIDNFVKNVGTKYNNAKNWLASKQGNNQAFFADPATAIGAGVISNPGKILAIAGGLYALRWMFSGKAPQVQSDVGKKMIEHFSQSAPSIQTPEIVPKMISSLAELKSAVNQFQISATSDKEKDLISKINQRIDLFSGSLTKLNSINFVLDNPSSAKSFISSYKDSETSAGYMIQTFDALNKLFVLHNQSTTQVDSIKELVSEFLSEIHNLRA